MYDEADALYVRAIGIGENALGPENPHLSTWLNNRAYVLEMQVRAVEAFQGITKRPHLSVKVLVHG